MNTFYTYSEILQQPKVWLEAYNIVYTNKAHIKSFVDKFLSQNYKIILTGAGTSAYIGNTLEKALAHTPWRGCRSIATTDIITNPSLFFDKNDKILLVSFARSGNSPESIATVDKVNASCGATAHIFITCNKNGELARRAIAGAKDTLYMQLPEATDDKSLAMTSSFSTMLLTCSMIANIDNIEKHKIFIEQLSAAVGDAINKYDSFIADIAKRDFNRAVFLGSGELLGIAEESRLKLQELTDGSVMCCFDSFVGFRHGPKAVVKKDALLVYLLSDNPNVICYEKDLVKQITANNNVKGFVAITQQPLDNDFPDNDLEIVIGLDPFCPICYKCVSYIFVAQLLGYHKSIDYGLNPDSPSVSGNISRVVEGVTIY